MSELLKDIFEKIQTANIYAVVHKTQLGEAKNLSERINNTLFLKREDQQDVFSFKIRGAFNKISHLTEEERSRGLLACSAGNHAQGVALSGQFYNCKTTIVMPVSTPEIKIKSVKSYGAEVILHGDSYQEASVHAKKLAEDRGYCFIHPFDDPLVIAGQGTIAKEIDEQCQEKGIVPDYVFVCVGGGGLASGIGAYFKSINSQCKIIGVEPEEAPTMQKALEAGKIVTLDWVGSFADGVAVKEAGQETFKVCQQVIDDMVLVSTDQICSAVKDAFEDTRVLMEPSGALSIAGVKKYVKEHNIQGKNIVAIASGANVNFDRLRHIAERTQIGERKEALLAVKLPEHPGALKDFCTLIGTHSITEFNYRYSAKDTESGWIFVGVGIENQQDRESFLSYLTENSIIFKDLSDDELSKLHIRHMIGGQLYTDREERVFRVEFPERAGALMDFLLELNTSRSITLFHYRCHGSDRGRVFIGLDVNRDHPVEDIFKKLNFSYWEETDNQAYQIFVA